MSAESAYLFRHPLLREAAYQLQLTGDRARPHGLSFSVLLHLAGGPPPERADRAVEIDAASEAWARLAELSEGSARGAALLAEQTLEQAL